MPLNQEKECDPLQPVDGATQQGSGTNFGVEIKLTCDNGRRFEDGYVTKVIRCVGEWTETDLKCVDNACTPVATVTHAVPDTLRATDGTNVTFTCEAGHQTPSGSTQQSASCDGGQWTGELQACEPISCPTIPLYYAVINSTQTTYNTYVNITCRPGYVLGDGSVTSYTNCLENATWSEYENCKPVDCGPVPLVPLASSQGALRTTYGHDVDMTCLSGYWVRRGITSQNMSCTAAGVWWPQPKPCVNVTCLDIPTWQGVLTDATLTSPGTVANLSCDSGLKLDGLSTDHIVTTCGSDGDWIPALPQCVATEPLQYYIPPLEEAQNSDKVGYISLSCVGIILLILLLSDLPMILTELHIGITGMVAPKPQEHYVRMRRESVFASLLNHPD